MNAVWNAWLFIASGALLTMLLLSLFAARVLKRSSLAAGSRHEQDAGSVTHTNELPGAEAAGRESERKLKAFIEQAAVGITKVTLDGVLVDVNRKFCDMLGYRRHEIIGKCVGDFTHPEDYGQGARFRAELGKPGPNSVIGEKRFIRKDGTIIWARRTMSVARDDDRQPQYILGIVEDISERKQAETALQQSEELFRQLAAHIPQVFWIGDIAQKEILYVSPAAEQLFGRPLSQFYAGSRTLIKGIHKEDRARVREARKRAASGDYDEVFRIVRADGTVRWVRDRAFPVHDAEGKLYRIAGIAEDITASKEAQERLEQLAHYDVLTNLPNRLLFYDRLKNALAQAKRSRWVVGVMFIDVDRFKYVNDTLGHAVGDILLRKVSERLTGSVRSNDTVGRLGGDEFAVVLSNLAGSEDAEAVAQKILASFNRPFELDGGTELYVTASIGLTLYPDDSTDHDSLLKNADLAMYRAKEEGRNTYERYVPEMSGRAAGHLDIYSLLRCALERNELELYYQPRLAVRTNRIIGVEALLRWNSRELGFVDPKQFIPIAEETGLIVPIGEWVIRAACARSKAWQDQGLIPVAVSVNLSPRQFREKNLVDMIAGILSETGLEARFLELEITESLIMSHADRTVALLERLHHLGVQVSIDDFGTGYSSLAYLKRFPVESIKIDQSFVRDLTIDPDDAAIVTAVVAMAKSLRLKVVAEGVENEEQLAFLASLNCDEYQGYYYSRPVPEKTLGYLLQCDQRSRMRKLT